MDLKAFIEDGGTRTPCEIRVSDPVPSAEDDYYCVVDVPALRISQKRVFGADQAQARELAIGIVMTMLGSKRLVDENGKAVDLFGL